MAGPTATRREIRRAFGAGALETLNSQGEALGKIIPILDAHQERLEAQAGVLADVAGGLDAHKQVHAAFVGRSLWQRLSWLVRGR